MRRIVLLGLMLSLSGCAGFGDFLENTQVRPGYANQPIGNSENIRRVEGRPSEQPPLLPEPGNVWPGPIVAPATLQELERQQNQEMRQYDNQPPPPPTTPGLPKSRGTPPSGNGSPSANAPAPGGNEEGGIMVPNGDGTSTLILPDGTVRTVPTPK